jgi:hypothetical protein
MKLNGDGAHMVKPGQIGALSGLTEENPDLGLRRNARRKEQKIRVSCVAP